MTAPTPGPAAGPTYVLIVMEIQPDGRQVSRSWPVTADHAQRATAGLGPPHHEQTMTAQEFVEHAERAGLFDAGLCAGHDPLREHLPPAPPVP